MITFRDLRENKAIDEIAKKLGIKSTTLIKYEYSIRTPSSKILAKMPAVYGCDANKVIEAYEYHKKEAMKKYGKINP